uniref:Uncharacterized protein n=1 Tax=Romanomermis culicivorax TaxID=13658 RepID=A0A915HJW6_ROMCU
MLKLKLRAKISSDLDLRCFVVEEDEGTTTFPKSGLTQKADNKKIIIILQNSANIPKHDFTNNQNQQEID